MPRNMRKSRNSSSILSSIEEREEISTNRLTVRMRYLLPPLLIRNRARRPKTQLKYLRIPRILSGKMGDITTVKVRKATRNRLAKLGNKTETFDDVIDRLIRFYKKNQQAQNGED